MASTASAQTRTRVTKKRIKRRHIDFWILMTALILLAIGSVMVFSSSAAYAYDRMEGDTYYFLKRQLIWVAVGIVVMFVMSNFDYRYLSKFAVPMLVISTIFLVLSAIPGIGIERNEARRWLGIGGVEFQPSEMVKISLIVFLSYSLSKRNKVLGSFTKGFVPYVLLAGFIAGILALQPHMSAALIIVSVTAIMMIVAGCKIRHFLAIGGLVIPFIIYIALKMPHVLTRVTSFMDPFANPTGEGYQIIQSLYAIGSGGLFGKGLGKSLQKYLYLPEPYNDFILSILAEELGFIGVVAVLFLFGLFIWRGYKVANHAPDMFGSLLAAGITSLIAIQVVLNVAVVTSSMPVTGIPLPFFSYGGTSLVFLMADVGILLNVSRYANYERF